MNIIEVLTGERLRVTTQLTEFRNRKEVPVPIPLGATVHARVRYRDVWKSGLVECLVASHELGEVIAIFPPSETEAWGEYSGCRIEWKVTGTDGAPEKWWSDPVINIYKSVT